MTNYNETITIDMGKNKQWSSFSDYNFDWLEMSSHWGRVTNVYIIKISQHWFR